MKWTEPKDDGSTDILGYVVQKRDEKSVKRGDTNWYMVNDKVRHTRCQVSNLISGNKYQFRVRAFNEVGIGEEAFTKDFADIVKERLIFDSIIQY